MAEWIREISLGRTAWITPPQLSAPFDMCNRMKLSRRTFAPGVTKILLLVRTTSLLFPLMHRSCVDIGIRGAGIGELPVNRDANLMHTG